MSGITTMQTQHVATYFPQGVLYLEQFPTRKTLRTTPNIVNSNNNPSADCFTPTNIPQNFHRVDFAEQNSLDRSIYI
jgi:hypothetical protein